MFIWGEMMDDVGSGPKGLETLDGHANWLLVIGAAAFVFGVIMVGAWNVFAEIISHKTRINYFRKCLERDAAFYDEHSAAEMASKISREVSAI